MDRNASALFASVLIAVAGSAGVADAAVVLNGNFAVATNSSQIGVVTDSSGFSNLTLAFGVPQQTDLFDLFSNVPVTAQPISVSFSLVQQGVGPLNATVNGTIAGLGGADDMGSVTFAPQTFRLASGDFLSINLSGATFGNDFNGTVTATFTAAMPEPASAILLGVGLAGLAAVSVSAARRRASPSGNSGLAG